MKDTCKQAIFRKRQQDSQEALRIPCEQVISKRENWCFSTGEPNSSYDLIDKFHLNTTFDVFDDYINKLLTITPQTSSTHNLLVNKHTTLWRGTIGFSRSKDI